MGWEQREVEVGLVWLNWIEFEIGWFLFGV